jgi:hypothetical protein
VGPKHCALVCLCPFHCSVYFANADNVTPNTLERFRLIYLLFHNHLHIFHSKFPDTQSLLLVVANPFRPWVVGLALMTKLIDYETHTQVSYWDEGVVGFVGGGGSGVFKAQSIMRWRKITARKLICRESSCSIVSGQSTQKTAWSMHCRTKENGFRRADLYIICAEVYSLLRYCCEQITPHRVVL